MKFPQVLLISGQNVGPIELRLIDLSTINWLVHVFTVCLIIYIQVQYSGYNFCHQYM